MSGRSRRIVTDVEEVATVAALTHDAEGIVRQGKAAFVAGALPGESIRFRRTRHYRQHDEAQLLEVLEPSAARVAPRCAHFGVCGGCALQHLAPEAQLEAKQTELRENLERVGRVSPQEWLEPLRGPVWNYRRRARLGAKFVIKKDRVVVGFRERLAPYVAEVQRCEVLSLPLGELIAPLAEILNGLSIRHRIPQIEAAVADNVVALVLRVLDPPSADDLARLGEFAARHSVRFYLQAGGLDSVRPLEGAAGAAAPLEPLRYGLPQFDLQLEFTPTDFIQINAHINEALVSRAVELLDLTPSSSVLDLFCGIGNFTLPLARRAGRVVGVEGEQGLVERARHNARLNDISNAEFHVADLGRAPEPGLPWLTDNYTHVLLDPPRAGAAEVLAAVSRLNPRRVLYISCHPGSFARDLGLLVHEHGMNLVAAGVLDMFPHTTHVESLALLEPRGPKEPVRRAPDKRRME
ncbi:MAG TPA: 23S rRNA (uracil(1939)-C(5))-methyltransferase RlmD [Steroidobacteraceae bacterium]|nr:23S rRNA (uracil(1939)-C(5))-methyltransferase RlmD [Steroidobacteraceae bacterium]